MESLSTFKAHSVSPSFQRQAPTALTGDRALRGGDIGEGVRFSDVIETNKSGSLKLVDEFWRRYPGYSPETIEEIIRYCPAKNPEVSGERVRAYFNLSYEIGSIDEGVEVKFVTASSEEIGRRGRGQQGQDQILTFGKMVAELPDTQDVHCDVAPENVKALLKLGARLFKDGLAIEKVMIADPLACLLKPGVTFRVASKDVDELVLWLCHPETPRMGDAIPFMSERKGNGVGASAVPSIESMRLLNLKRSELKLDAVTRRTQAGAAFGVLELAREHRERAPSVASTQALASRLETLLDECKLTMPAFLGEGRSLVDERAEQEGAKFIQIRMSPGDLSEVEPGFKESIIKDEQVIDKGRLSRETRYVVRATGDRLGELVELGLRENLRRLRSEMEDWANGQNGATPPVVGREHLPRIVNGLRQRILSGDAGFVLDALEILTLIDRKLANACGVEVLLGGGSSVLDAAIHGGGQAMEALHLVVSMGGLFDDLAPRDVLRFFGAEPGEALKQMLLERNKPAALQFANLVMDATSHMGRIERRALLDQFAGVIYRPKKGFFGGRRYSEAFLKFQDSAPAVAKQLESMMKRLGSGSRA